LAELVDRLNTRPFGLVPSLEFVLSLDATRGFWKNIFTDLTGKFVSYK